MNFAQAIPQSRPSLPDAAPEMARRLGMIVAGVAALIARRFLRMPHLVGLIVPLWGRLTRAARRFEKLVTQPTTIRALRAPRNSSSRAKGMAFPSRRGWLVRELGWEAAGYRCQLEALLAEPAMQAILANLPGAGRVLRPLCRMLGVQGAVVPAPAPAVIIPDGEVRSAKVARVWPSVPEEGMPGLPAQCAVPATPG